MGGESNSLNRYVHSLAALVEDDSLKVNQKLSTNDIKFSRLTGTSTGTVEYSITSTSGLWSLLEIRAHLSAVGAAGSLKATLNNGAGAVYDSVLLLETLTTVTDVLYLPVRDIKLNADDSVDIAWDSPTTGAAVTFGFEAVYKVL